MPRVDTFMIYSFLCLLGHSVVAVPLQNFMESLEAYLPTYKTPITSPEIANRNHSRRHASCVLGPTQSCPLSNMSTIGSTLVFPGGSTRCIFSHSSDYSFQVFRGATDRVLIYFQGGGTCWNRASTDLHLCATNADPEDEVGIFDRSNPANPYREHTILHVLYCSGDAHSGNITRPYTDILGKKVVQAGYNNTRAALDWLKINLGNSQLRPLNDLVVAGCSAGSIGVQTWAASIFRMFAAQKKAFLADSFAGVFPSNSMGVTIKSYGMCDLELIPASLKEACRNETLSMHDYVENTIASHPEVPFTFVQSKEDIVQRGFYAAIAASFGGNPYLPVSEFYQAVNTIWERYAKHQNFMSFSVEGCQHCYSNLPIFYTADTSSKDGSIGQGNGDAKVEKLVKWVRQLHLLDYGGNISTACYGALQDPSNATGTSYCDSKLAGRTYSRA